MTKLRGQEIIGIEKWGLVFEGPVRKTLRTKIGDFLGVPESPYPVRDFLRKRIPR